MKKVAIIVGSGALELGGEFDFAADPCGTDTPYGPASSVPLVARRGDVCVYTLSRHGDGHRLAPHQVNYRANVTLLANLGVSEVISINTVGGIAATAHDGALVLPDQLIDYTWGREHTFADEANLQHVDFSEPYDAGTRRRLLQAAQQANVALRDGGVYGCTQGPRFESAAEITRMERDGCCVVGMTGMPETSLARELGLAYASVCLVVNPAAGKAPSIDLSAIAEVAREGMQRVARLVVAFLEGVES